jgi:hypothetical protein
MFRTSPPKTHAGREALEAWRAAAHLASARWQTFLDAESTTRGFAFASYLAALEAEDAAAADVAALGGTRPRSRPSPSRRNQPVLTRTARKEQMCSPTRRFRTR